MTGKDTVVEEIIPEENDAGMSDTLFIIGFSIFVLFLFVGEIIPASYISPQGLFILQVENSTQDYQSQKKHHQAQNLKKR